MTYLYLAVELVIVIFASWTIAYEVVLFSRMPARSVLAFFVVFLLVLILGYARWWKRYLLALDQKQERFLAGVLILGVVVGIFAALSLRPDYDDVNYLHRPLLQLRHQDEPLFQNTTGFDRDDLPPMSMAHIMVSYESLIVFTSNVLHLDPISVYHNATSVVFGLLVVIVYDLL